MKRLLRMILSRTSFILLLLLLQIAAFILVLHYISRFTYVHTILYLITDIIVIYLIYKEENPVYKLSWIVPILIFPLFGGFFYLFYKNRNVSKKVIKRFEQADKERFEYLYNYQKHKPQNNKIETYLHNIGWMSFNQTRTDFLGSGESMFESMKASLLEAKSYIFLEFFIIKDGQMWQEILDILKQKVLDGVEVYLIYDDFGSSSLPYKYPRTLKSYGIHAHAFNPMRIHLNFAMNYRDHKKIVIIDGKIAYTGGINIGDEYINLEHPFGHWQDAGIKLEGRAVTALVINYINQLKFMGHEHLDLEDYVIHDFNHISNDAMVIPFTDVPIDHELANKNVYMQMIMQAKKEILVTTPYLIIDNELATALKLAAKSGIDVKIIIPYIPDKKIVFIVTESYAEELIQAGVKIYRYKPGFIHSKMMIIDDEVAMIGTANLDFRSLYLHFENSVYLEDKNTINEMRAFFNHTTDVSTLVSDVKNPNLFVRILKVVLRGFASLM